MPKTIEVQLVRRCNILAFSNRFELEIPDDLLDDQAIREYIEELIANGLDALEIYEWEPNDHKLRQDSFDAPEIYDWSEESEDA